MAADRPYGEFYDFYSIDPEDSGYHYILQYSTMGEQCLEETTINKQHRSNHVSMQIISAT
jgi:hypothetical protein